ncbi:hypothetical protein C427_3419 [Paraglaciecola psychrophila 170]|uniref:Uncharacterized protein n=1 Tax=Paraglaciecola psychrophila 170 TaxID=1129794 RepID=K7ASE9_9ALTE|nr:hypothetical protein C427_3419 [Paraglaciecola psychrophila 170]GAC38190.1 hypothetical protein GPSY_2576 [Paraglaciecola psychrophila 170]
MSFEAIYLWLQEQSAYLPSHLKDQIENINKRQNCASYLQYYLA